MSIPIGATDVSNTNIMNLKQVIMGNVHCASVVSKVNNGHALVSVTNNSEVVHKL